MIEWLVKWFLTGGRAPPGGFRGSEPLSVLQQEKFDYKIYQ